MTLRIGANHCKTCAAVQVGGNEIQFVEKARYLGVYLCAAKHFRISYTTCKVLQIS